MEKLGADAVRINKFLRDKIMKCPYRETDCIKYDWRFGDKAEPDAIRQWLRERPCDNCAFGLQVFRSKPIPGWEYMVLQAPITGIDRTPVILKPEIVRERLGYFDVTLQLAVPSGGLGFYTEDPEDSISVLFPLAPREKSWVVRKADIAGFAGRCTLIYFAKFFKELHTQKFESVVTALCQSILDVGGDVDCLYK